MVLSPTMAAIAVAIMAVQTVTVAVAVIMAAETNRVRRSARATRRRLDNLWRDHLALTAQLNRAETALQHRRAPQPPPPAPGVGRRRAADDTQVHGRPADATQRLEQIRVDTP